jgi:hypothetical protein
MMMKFGKLNDISMKFGKIKTPPSFGGWCCRPKGSYQLTQFPGSSTPSFAPIYTPVPECSGCIPPHLAKNHLTFFANS